jgi:hypothetical protein
MSPDKRPRKSPIKSVVRSTVKLESDPHDAHDIVYFQQTDDRGLKLGVPGREALNSWPPGVRAKARARLITVAAAPPYRFSGGGYWEAMSDEMAGRYELRVDGESRHHYRLFCVIDARAQRAMKPYVAVIQGPDKSFRTTFTSSQY